MAIPIASATTLSVAANATSADQVKGRYQYITQNGKYTLIALGSATGLNYIVNVGGVSIADDLAIPYFGTTGSLDSSAHIAMAQDVNGGGRVELFFRNTTGAALTADFILLFEPK